MNDFDYVYLMCFSTEEIVRIDISNEEDDDIERIIKKAGYNMDEVEYMYSNDEIEIKEL